METFPSYEKHSGLIRTIQSLKGPLHDFSGDEVFESDSEIYKLILDIRGIGQNLAVGYIKAHGPFNKMDDVISKGDCLELLETIEKAVKGEITMGFPMGETTDNKDNDKDGHLVFLDDQGIEHKALGHADKLADRGSLDGITNTTFGKLVRARITGDFSQLNEVELKAVGEGVGSLGGFLVPSAVASTVYDLARNKAVCLLAGALTIPVETKELTLVKVTADPTAYWRKEHQEITESDPTMEPITLAPMVNAVLVRVSKELVEDVATISETLTSIMSGAIAVEMDRCALFGNGTTEPRGLDLCTGINEISMGTNGAALTNFDEFSNACEDIEQVNGNPTSVIYNPRTHFALDRLKAATTNQPLVAPASFQDLRKFRSNQVGITDTQGTATNASKAFVGDFSNMVFGLRSSMKIDVSGEASDTFEKLDILIRMFVRMDLAVIRENHFTRIQGIIPA